ncbi:MAG: S8 family serine peptidase [Actinomycetota bacterium]
MSPSKTLAIVGVLVAASLAANQPAAEAKKPSRRGPSFRPHVVVATLDTGTNPFHPTWRRDERRHPSKYIPGYPTSARRLALRLGDGYAADVKASRTAFENLSKEKAFPYWVPGTNLVGLWAHETDAKPIFDHEQAASSNATHSHGAAASSQIAGRGYGMAPGVYLVVVDTESDEGQDAYKTNGEALRWAADQPWIDIIHTNIQDPVPLNNEQGALWKNYPDALRYAVDKGKLVVSPGGNFYAEPTETSPHAGPPGVLAAGANDNCGYADFSNPDPHVVMDGYGTVAAAPNGYGDTSFGGTSGSSPRITGYAAQLLLRIRRSFGYRGNTADGTLVMLPKKKRPVEGPLADGNLTAAELHEVIRKTANPNPHESKYDGDQVLGCIPQPTDLPASFYPKMGYGEVSEHTIDAAFEVAIGKSPMQSRRIEDQFYGISEELRALFWD